MRRVVWSSYARSEFKDIIGYIAQDDPKAARGIAGRIDHTIRSLSHMPTGRKGRVSGTYEKMVGGLPYIIAYALGDDPPHQDTITILHVIHGARDWPEETWQPTRTRKGGTLSTLVFRPLTPRLMDAFSTVLRGSWGGGCWCMHQRLTDAQMRELPGQGSASQRKRAAMTKLAQRRRAPGLLAFEGDEPVGWIAIAPRSELARIEASRATPRVDDADVWVIPCVTVRKTARGRGIALAMIGAAVAYAAEQGAPAIEAYPRAGAARTGDDNAYFGTEPLFHRAGFRVVRAPLQNRPRNWIARVAMRIDAPR